jgi:hypothetical protein
MDLWFEKFVEKTSLHRCLSRLLMVLNKTNWKIHGKDGAAALLDINPSTLRGRMRKQGIHRPPYKT